MKIAFDAQLLLSEEKTGIGWNEYYLIDELTKNNAEEIKYQLNLFNSPQDKEGKELIQKYIDRRCNVRIASKCSIPYVSVIWRRLFNKYQNLFGRKSDITVFFNYEVPKNVGTKTAVYVCDVNYLVFPETVESRTLKWLNDNLKDYCDRADYIITISEFSKSEIVKYLGIEPSKIVVVPCGVNYSIYRKYDEVSIKESLRKYSIPKDYILYLGTLEPRKNIPILIDAYKLLTERTTDVPPLVIAGKKGWLYDSIFEKVKEYGLEESVIFTGYVDSEDAPKLMAGATIFCFPSIYEGFGMPPLESMACGTPVIVSDSASLPEVVADGGLIFKQGDAEDLYSKIRLLLEDDNLRKEYIEKGLERSNELSWENAATKLKQQLFV